MERVKKELKNIETSKKSYRDVPFLSEERKNLFSGIEKAKSFEMKNIYESFNKISLK